MKSITIPLRAIREMDCPVRCLAVLYYLVEIESDMAQYIDQEDYFRDSSREMDNLITDLIRVNTDTGVFEDRLIHLWFPLNITEISTDMYIQEQTIRGIVSFLVKRRLLETMRVGRNRWVRIGWDVPVQNYVGWWESFVEQYIRSSSSTRRVETHIKPDRIG